MRRRCLSLLVLLLAVLSVTACIYDFTPVVEEAQSVVVIEGDILVGGYTDVRISESRPLETPFREMPVTGWPAGAAARVEASDGTVYQGMGSRIDTRAADPGQQYRLVVSYRNRTYVSAWESVVPAAAIDSISYTVSSDHLSMTIDVTSHGNADNLYYRWTAREDWEYHTPYSASHYFVPAGSYDREGNYYKTPSVVPYKNGENSYYCWSSGRVAALLLASAEALSENRIVRHDLYSISCYERRISYIYSVELTQLSLSETAYRYWENIQKNSGDVGGLFSPEPFDMRGNLSCEEDPDEWVVGYISASFPSVKRIFIDAERIGFPRISVEDRAVYDLVPFSTVDVHWPRLYRSGYVPYAHTPMGEPNEFDWIDRRCVDCRVWGNGSKVKPDFWPNDHK